MQVMATAGESQVVVWDVRNCVTKSVFSTLTATAPSVERAVDEARNVSMALGGRAWPRGEEALGKVCCCGP